MNIQTIINTRIHAVRAPIIAHFVQLSGSNYVSCRRQLSSSPTSKHVLLGHCSVFLKMRALEIQNCHTHKIPTVDQQLRMRRQMITGIVHVIKQKKKATLVGAKRPKILPILTLQAMNELISFDILIFVETSE